MWQPFRKEQGTYLVANTPCKSTCLYNAPGLHIVEIIAWESPGSYFRRLGFSRKGKYKGQTERDQRNQICSFSPMSDGCCLYSEGKMEETAELCRNPSSEPEMCYK